METKDWRILSILYEEKNITKAAHRLYISQPALSYRIQQIEREFGTSIVIRGKKGVEFTASGEEIALYAKRMELELQKIKDRVSDSEHYVKGVLRLGASSTFAHYKLPELLKQFVTKYEHVDINVQTGWTSEILQHLQKEEIQIAIVRGDIEWGEEKHLVYTEPIQIVSKRDITLEDLPNMTRINYKTDLSLKVILNNWWNSRYKLNPPTTMEVDNIQTCKELVKKDLGYAILPSICLQESDQLKTVPLIGNDGEIILRNTWIICRKELLNLSIIREFVNFSIEHLQNPQNH